MRLVCVIAPRQSESIVGVMARCRKSCNDSVWESNSQEKALRFSLGCVETTRIAMGDMAGVEGRKRIAPEPDPGWRWPSERRVEYVGGVRLKDPSVATHVRGSTPDDAGSRCLRMSADMAANEGSIWCGYGVALNRNRRVMRRPDSSAHSARLRVSRSLCPVSSRGLSD